MRFRVPGATALRARLVRGRRALAAVVACRAALGGPWRRVRRRGQVLAVRADGRTLPWGDFVRQRRTLAGLGRSVRREGPRLALGAGLVAVGCPGLVASLAARSLPC
jgi:hypothetical protein